MKEWIYGRNPVYECLRASRRHIFNLLIAEGARVQGRLKDLIVLAEEKNLNMTFVPKDQLDHLDDHHQGVALEASGYPYVQLEDIFNLAEERNETLFMLMLDQIQDPQNFGTLIRSAEVFGLHGILIPPHRAAGITPAVVNVSSGASEHLYITQANLAQAADLVKEAGGWVFGLDMNSESRALDEVDLTGNLALVIGSEGSGLRRLVSDKCDMLVHIPMVGKLDSLNAAVAGSIALYAAFIQRRRRSA